MPDMQEYTEIVLPDLFSLTPFPWTGRNPNYSPDEKRSTDWMLGFDIFTDKMRAHLSASYAELLAACVYNYANAKGLRVGSDTLALLIALDGITDAQDPESVKATCDTIVNALTGMSGDDHSQVTMLTKEYAASLPSMSDELRKRFVADFAEFLDGAADEAQLREANEMPSFEKYTRIRRKSGISPALFDVIEIVLGIALPAELFEEPSFKKIYDAMNDIICISNDIYSFATEHERGLDGSNLVAVFMKSKGLSAQDAMDHTAIYYKGLVDTVIFHKGKVRSFGVENDKAIHAYIHGLEQWAYGALVWSFDTKRYYGEEFEEVKRTGFVRLKKRESSV